MSSLDWYVAYTKAQGEARAAEGVARHGFQVFLPILKQRVRRRGKRLIIERPLFQRYVFLGFIAAPPWLEIARIEGIQTIVRNNGRPLRVDNAIVDQLRVRVAGGEFEQRKPPSIRPGMNVKIVAGPMLGAEGICAAVTDDVRVELFVKMLNQTIRVQINIDQLVEAT